MAVYLNPLDNPDAWNVVVFGKLSTPIDAKVKVEGWARKNDYDIKVGRGAAGATETLKGQPPAEGTITVWAWTPAHFAAFNPIFQLLTYKPGKGNAQGTAPASGSSAASQFALGGDTGGGGSASGTIPQPGNTSGVPADPDAFKGPASPPALSKNDAIKIYYPSLADINVTAIIPPSELGIWEEDGEASGMWKRTIKCIEFAQAANANIATTPTGAGDGGAPGATYAGGSEGSAPSNGAAQQQGAASGAQGAWGSP